MKGWILYVEVLTDDCYGTMILQYQGAELELREARLFPEFYMPGFGVQDPSGWCPYYYRPNPVSTAGIYSVIAFSGGFQGSPLPFVPVAIAKLYLPPESTQESAYVSGAIAFVAITDEDKFTESLREVLSVSETNTLLRELIEVQKGGGRR